MDLLPTVDQVDIMTTVEQYLGQEWSSVKLHNLVDAGATAGDEIWCGAAGLGIFALGLSEDAGGAGCPIVEEALVFQVMGRRLAPIGFLASVLASRMAHALGENDLRDAVVAGTQRVALAVPTGDGGLQIFDGDHAALIVMAAEPWGLAWAPSEDRGEAVECLDPSVRMAALSSVPELLPVPAAAVEETRQLGTLLTSAMLVGVAEAARDASVGYAKERVQFGRPIGAHQAIKHRCADMAVRTEAAASLLHFAALALRDGRGDSDFQIAAAKRIATDAALSNALANIQVHGGMGFTWEHDAHLLLSRAHLLDQLFGNVRAQQASLLCAAPAVP
ncbi:acyl-CoA dehydrogenase family protein [[Mycobacterium] vasticus]|uniref:Acyl-CoA dehydrogenase family protein n=1 Tax=[Mycobacterium] vasticus TaxID=2875777 RepID=A0ABU5YZY4_9MYCO|nr:acyl-CoA dehydrogenase family protein [Mycolicibacter sp. MYC017]MEB3070704.1 acyl-CoA dehydrogenase family protein [Mycolicibacter sp. MYC017]